MTRRPTHTTSRGLQLAQPSTAYSSAKRTCRCSPSAFRLTFRQMRNQTLTTGLPNTGRGEHGHACDPVPTVVYPRRGSVQTSSNQSRPGSLVRLQDRIQRASGTRRGGLHLVQPSLPRVRPVGRDDGSAPAAPVTPRRASHRRPGVVFFIGSLDTQKSLPSQRCPTCNTQGDREQSPVFLPLANRQKSAFPIALAPGPLFESQALYT